MKTTAIVDLQFGSTGKGLMAGYYSQKNPEIDVVVSANMPNAGHTFVDSSGVKWVNKVLPSGVYGNSKIIGIGPGAVFDIDRLNLEMKELRQRFGLGYHMLIIHESAVVLRQEHKFNEQTSMAHIASTAQGSMEAAIHKMRRPLDTAPVALNHRFHIESNAPDVNVVSHAEWLRTMASAEHILAEGSQGYSLGINAGFYPYCTSRDCTVQRLLADCAIPAGRQMYTIGTARVHPIRVGNVEGGNSGPCYADQEETTWEELGQTPETTTVTGRVRRVFTFSNVQIAEAMLVNGVDAVFLNFCNYNPRESVQIAEVINEARRHQLAKQYAMHPFALPDDRFKVVRWMGFGPQAEDIIEVGRHD